MDIFRHFKRPKAALPSDWQERITPDFVSTLQDNEIFVFGCRNSGRHFDGASAFALKHFGAIFGQREGAQGQSYAIPTIGGIIGLKAIGESVMRFTEYAAAHPELRLLVTAIGCGGVGWHSSCILYTSPSPRDRTRSRMPSSALTKHKIHCIYDLLAGYCPA